MRGVGQIQPAALLTSAPWRSWWQHQLPRSWEILWWHGGSQVWYVSSHPRFRHPPPIWCDDKLQCNLSPLWLHHQPEISKTIMLRQKRYAWFQEAIRWLGNHCNLDLGPISEAVFKNFKNYRKTKKQRKTVWQLSFFSSRKADHWFRVVRQYGRKAIVSSFQFEHKLIEAGLIDFANVAPQLTCAWAAIESYD